MTIPKMAVGNCDICGKELHLSYCKDRQLKNMIPQNFREFNNGKIKRCLDCCKMLGIKEAIKIINYQCS